MTSFFQRFSIVYLDLFHGGYPYIQEVGILAKYIPNVYIDGCWFSHISSSVYKRGLNEWLEIAPANKIFALGGDHKFIEHSYAFLMLAKDLVSEVLAAKVSSEYFTKKVTLSVVEKIMGQNTKEVYNL